MKLICSIHLRCDLWPFFVRYYADQGVTEFLVNLWPEMKSAAGFLAEHTPAGIGLEFFDCRFDTYSGERDSSALSHIRRKRVEPDEWYIIADLDEFHSFSEGTISEIVIKYQNGRIDYFQGFIVDRIADDGRIPQRILYDLGLGQQFPVGVELTKNVLEGCSKKVIAIRGDMTIRPGHHKSGGVMAPIMGLTHHFKWYGELVKIQIERLASYQKQNLHYANESEKLVNFVNKGQGAINVSDPLINARRFPEDPTSRLLPFIPEAAAVPEQSWKPKTGL